MASDSFIDFESWCRNCVRITDKLTGKEVPFVLNAPQRRVLKIMEDCRKEGKPIRIILLKARQWGGSTLVQVYMAWMQLVVKRGWNSVVCAHVKDASASIRGMYTRLLNAYPDNMKSENPGSGWKLAPYEKSRDICRIAARDCLVALATAAAPDSVRGGAFQMAHLSEVAFWAGETEDGDAARIVRTVCGSIPLSADTLVVMESTADGPRGYFHDEWQRAVRGESDKIPIFVPWFEIEIYSREVKPDEVLKLTRSLDDYERDLLNRGIAVEKVAWYHYKRREYPTHRQMMAEYPGSPEEAFAFSSDPLLSAEYTDCISHSDAEPQSDAKPIMAATFSSVFCSLWRCGDTIELQTDISDLFSLRELLQKASEIGVPLILPEAVTEQNCHASWLAANADAAGVVLKYTAEGENKFLLSCESLNMLVDHFGEFMRETRLRGIKVVDRDSEALTEMATLRGPAANLLAFPRLLCRLCLLWAADDILCNPMLSLSDFVA